MVTGLNAETLFEVKDSANNKVFDVSNDGIAVMNLGDTLMVISTKEIKAVIDDSKALSRKFSVSTTSAKKGQYTDLFDVTLGSATMRESGGVRYTDFSPENIFLGLQSGINTTPGVPSNYSGLDNVFIGNVAGKSNTSGYQNIFIGDSTGTLNTSGGHNIFIGNKAGKSNLTGTTNLFIGEQAGEANEEASFNIFFGYGAGLQNVSGSGNTFIGFCSGMQSKADYNTFIGNQSGNFCTTGKQNTLYGYRSGIYLRSGNDNVFMGYNTGMNLDGGSKNIFIGSDCGFTLPSGDGNVFIGYRAGCAQYTEIDSCLIIDSSYEGTDNENNALIYGRFNENTLRFNGTVSANCYKDPVYALKVNGGTSSTYSAYFYKGAYAEGSFVSGSDIKWKTNISTLSGSLDRIKKIRGVNFDWRKNEFPDKGFSDRKQIGVIAQEVEKVLPELVYTDSNGDKGVDYAKMSAILVEAIKELDAKTSEIESLKAEIEKIKQFVKMEK